jgi:hypothetical protein
MSDKINVGSIISGHLKTLCDPKDVISKYDVFTFFGLALIFAIVGIYCSVTLNKELISLLVNFGAIFTALLLSVLVLVYDQEVKIDEGQKTQITSLKKKLLNQLYYNISYAIILSIFLVSTCFLITIVGENTQSIFVIKDYSIVIKYNQYFLTPTTIFMTTNLVLTIVMIVKRMNILLTTK